jgi:hypothetical protein
VIKLRVLDLFSGIGGFSLGLERTGGFETVAFCEIEPFPRKVLAKHWPEVPCYEDVTKLTGDILARDGIAVDVITGGFPCQDISCAGKRAGIGEGTRSGLWSEIVRLISELSPRYVTWRTSQTSLVALLTGEGDGLAEYSETWPSAGIIRNGKTYRRQPWAEIKRGSEYGLLPTVTKSDGTAQGNIYSVRMVYGPDTRGIPRR